MEKKIVVDINKDGSINAETFGFNGVGCVDALDKLLKDIALSSENTLKPEYFKDGCSTDTLVENKTE